ncbi:hypothetical protein AN641_05320 [Candidatus Epulonipiscioides gigas]|nr:hypothetical protein AN641_05320 [Epulopiscium sp. SCG-C07WGA-EpuloA2]
MINNVIDLKKVRNMAERYYNDKEFYCAEAVVCSLEEVFDLELSEDMIDKACGFRLRTIDSKYICGDVAYNCAKFICHKLGINYKE